MFLGERLRFFLRHFAHFRRRSKVLGVRNESSSAAFEIGLAPNEVERTGRSIRNIGIMAHIDAGKTTTTERMLFYSGFSRVLGDVDDGDTIMDYMEQERDRGITITSAAISFPWANHSINLIDTPGHVDFTVEVERSLRVLDGAVAILDATAGVEAQSLTVWRQADRYDVPRIIYLNKMDKPKANVGFCLDSISEKFQVKPLLTQLPLFRDKAFRGIVDLIRMENVEWLIGEDTSGKTLKRQRLSELDGTAWEKASSARQQLVEQTVELDEELAETVLTAKGEAMPSEDDLERALRRITLRGSGVAVFCGSSYRNVGVQALLDAVVKYLPSPSDRSHKFVQFYGKELCALVFKIIHDRQKGRLTFLRVYSGKIEQGQKVYNVGRKTSEKLNKLLVAYADDFKEIKNATAGSIVVVTGLKNVVTGDTLVSGQGAAQSALQASKRDSSGDGEDAVLAGVQIPKPVFFCSIEPASLKFQTPLEQALECLQIEDPSFTVKVDTNVGQTIIGGMGELHIDIIKDRLRKEFKVDADVGPLQVAYQETLRETFQLENVFERTLGKSKCRILVHLSVEPQEDEPVFAGLLVAPNKEARENASLLRVDQMEALRDGVASALGCGPLLGFPLTHVTVHLHRCLLVPPGASHLMIAAAASQCLQKMLAGASASVRLMEPIMSVEVVTDKRCLHNVLADLTQRKSHVLEVLARHDAEKVVRVRTPLVNLLGYATNLRVITSGTATFAMEFHSYRLMTPQDQRALLHNITGFV